MARVKKPNGGKRRVTDLKFREVKEILEANGYELVRRANNTHAKFLNRETGHQVVCSGFSSKTLGRKVDYPIVQKIFKECGIKF